MFWVVLDYSNSKLRDKQYKQKNLPNSCKFKLKILANPGFANNWAFNNPAQGSRYVLKAGDSNKSIDVSQWIHWLHSTILSHYYVYTLISDCWLNTVSGLEIFEKILHHLLVTSK